VTPVLQPAQLYSSLLRACRIADPSGPDSLDAVYIVRLAPQRVAEQPRWKELLCAATVNTQHCYLSAAFTTRIMPPQSRLDAD
jgi:hypothetical protein